MTENLAVLVCITEKFTPKKCMTQYVTLCMTQNLGATLLKIGVYDTKMYDTKCKTQKNMYYSNAVYLKTLMQVDLARLQCK